MKLFFMAVLTLVTLSAGFGQAATDSKSEQIIQTGAESIQITANTLARDEYYYYNFGSQWTHFTTYADFTLSMSAHETRPVKLSVRISGMAYDAWHNCPMILHPGQRCRATVAFRPPFDGFYPGTLAFLMSDKNIFIDLAGWGRR